MNSKAISLTLLAVCEVSVFALWFSATAVIPSLTQEVNMSATQISLLSSAVQGGFVVGTLVSAIFTLADRFDPRRFFMIAALIATAANGLILVSDPAGLTIILMRFITGACMAGTYPVGLKIVNGWAKGDLGLLAAVLVGALTLGTAAPHFLNAFGGVDWRFTIASASAIALVAALLINFVQLGPHHIKSPAFDPKAMLKGFATPSIRLANFGYLGHMWELFAMWAWLGVFLDASFHANGNIADPAFWARLSTFAVMGVGGVIGCVLGGILSDRYGRTWLTMWAMGISGCCALITGFLFGAPPWLLVIICFVWGMTVIADSAQFSASIAELSPPDLVGTMITVQTCSGFLLTLISIHLMPIIVGQLGWGLAFALLAIGPVFGVYSMGRLRRHPEAVKLAGGKG